MLLLSHAGANVFQTNDMRPCLLIYEVYIEVENLYTYIQRSWYTVHISGVRHMSGDEVTGLSGSNFWHGHSNWENKLKTK